MAPIDLAYSGIGFTSAIFTSKRRAKCLMARPNRHSLEKPWIGGPLRNRSKPLEVPQIRHLMTHCEQNSSPNPHGVSGGFFTLAFRLRSVLWQVLRTALALTAWNSYPGDWAGAKACAPHEPELGRWHSGLIGFSTKYSPLMLMPGYASNSSIINNSEGSILATDSTCLRLGSPLSSLWKLD